MNGCFCFLLKALALHKWPVSSPSWLDWADQYLSISPMKELGFRTYRRLFSYTAAPRIWASILLPHSPSLWSHLQPDTDCWAIPVSDILQEDSTAPEHELCLGYTCQEANEDSSLYQKQLLNLDRPWNSLLTCSLFLTLGIRSIFRGKHVGFSVIQAWSKISSAIIAL